MSIAGLLLRTAERRRTELRTGRASGTVMVEERRHPPRRQDSGRRQLTAADFDRLHPKLVTMFRRAGASAEDARDLTQEVFLRSHRGLAAFRGHSELDTWMCSIAKRVWLQHCRDRGRQKRRLDEVGHEGTTLPPEEVAAGPGLEEHLIARDLLDRARRAIPALPEAMRQALLLYVQGHKYRSIAELLGVSENHVSSLIHQGREKLRRSTGELPADSSP